MKLYESLNKRINEGVNEWLNDHIPNPFIALPKAAWKLSGGKYLWNRARRKTFQHDSPDEFNTVNGGFFFVVSSKDMRQLNDRIAKILGAYLRKDASGNIVLDNGKLNQMKQEDPELFSLIWKLQKSIAWGNNRSNLWMSRKHKDAIRNSLNDLEVYLSSHNQNSNPMKLSKDTISILKMHPQSKELLARYMKAKPGSEEQRKLYALIMNAERELVNNRPSAKNSSYLNDRISKYVQDTPFYNK